jgi:hypothetical protein
LIEKYLPLQNQADREFVDRLWEIIGNGNRELIYFSPEDERHFNDLMFDAKLSEDWATRVPSFQRSVPLHGRGGAHYPCNWYMITSDTAH